MILGIGIDLVEVGRIEQAIRKRGERFVSRIFTPAEISYCQRRERPAEHFAARFAAKEAIAKALDLAAPGGVRWHEVEVLHLPSGRPEVKLTGKSQASARQAALKKLHISLTHTTQFAFACAVAES